MGVGCVHDYSATFAPYPEHNTGATGLLRNTRAVIPWQTIYIGFFLEKLDSANFYGVCNPLE